MTTIWKSTLYRTKYSRKVDGYLHVEGATRAEALALLAEMVVAAGSAGWHARTVLAGTQRHTLTRERGGAPYAAKDGTWRGWGVEAWQATPPAAYARWRDVVNCLDESTAE